MNNILTYFRLGEPHRRPIRPGGGVRRRQRLLARRLAHTRRRRLLRRLLCCLDRLEAMRIGFEGGVHLNAENLEPWLQRLEAYDTSAEPLRVYLRGWQRISLQQRALMLRVVGRELRQLGQLLPPLQRSLVAPAAHSEGFRRLANILAILDPESLRPLVEEEAL
jgi:hypothetical protein